MAKKRVRKSTGHNVYFNSLKRELSSKEKLLNKLKSEERVDKRKVLKTEKLISSIKETMQSFTAQYNKPYKDKFNHVTRQSVFVDPNNPCEEEYINDVFEQIKAFQDMGQKVPDFLNQKVIDARNAPPIELHLTLLSHVYSKLNHHKDNIIKNVPWELFLTQSDVNKNWIEFQGVTEDMVREKCFELNKETNSELLKNKEYLFVGSFISYTADPSFAQVLLKIVKDRNLDGIIVAGPWTKDIYKYRVFGNPIIEQVRELIKSTQVIAIRSYQDDLGYLPELIGLGVKFVTFLENDKNIFFGDRLSTASTKNQLEPYKDLDLTKNIFTYTSYVAFETILKKNEMRYIVGSGSSSINTGRANMKSQAYHRQYINSLKYDSTGGHLLRFDNEGNVSVNSFHFSVDIDGAPLAGKFYPAVGKVQKTKLAVLASDIHVSHMDPYAFAAFLDFLDRRGSDTSVLYLNGDFFDNAVLSHWNENRIDEQIKISNDKNLGCFLHEIHKARKALEMIVSKIDPSKTKLYFKWGNHEINSLAKIKNKSLLHFLDAILDLNDLLNLKKYGFETIDSKEVFMLGDLPILHGNELPVTKARQNLGRKCVYGHSHQCKIGNYGTVLPSMHVNKGVGYSKYSHLNWAPGWGVSHIIDNHYSKVELMLMHDQNSYYDFDGRVFIKEPAKIEIDQREISLLLKY